MLISISIIIVVLLVVGYLFIIYSAKQEVNDVKRVPMLECQTHGLFPESAAVVDAVPVEGSHDVSLKLCPFCIHERFVAVEKALQKG